MSHTPDERDEKVAELVDEARAEFRASGDMHETTERARSLDVAADVRALLDTARWLDSAVMGWRLLPSAALPDREALPEQIGRYRIQKKLGEGGMGTVYLAHDPELDRTVALKMPRIVGSKSEQASRRQRFVREARAAAAIRHENVCPIYDVGQQDDRPYVVMAFLEGESFADRLQGGRQFDSLPDAVRILREIAEALSVVHRHGIVHRDLKPGNIMIDRSGRAILMDFGLARVEAPAGVNPHRPADSLPLEPETPSPDAEITHVATAKRENGETTLPRSGDLTRVGAIVGTPAYMAPEQARGEPATPQSDLYSLGCVAYRMLTGRPPREDKNTSSAHLKSPLARIQPLREKNRRIPPAISGLIMRLLAEGPHDRPAAAREVANELAVIEARLHPKPRLRWYVAAAAVVAAGVAIALPFLVPANPPKPSGEPFQFHLSVFHRVGNYPYQPVIADFNHDGHLDLAVSNSRNDNITLMYGDGTGSFRTKAELAAATEPLGLAAADFNRDGRLDLAVAALKCDACLVFLGQPDDSFQPGLRVPVGSNPRGLTVADLNDDGVLDLITANIGDTKGDRGISVCLGRGDGSFHAATHFATGPSAIATAVGDLNRDGRADVVVSSSSGDRLSILLGRGDGTFRDRADVGVGSGPGAVVLADFDRDGFLDAAVENFGSNDVRILLGLGNGTFAPARTFHVGVGPGGLAAADFNGDGFHDLAVANHTSHNLSILLNEGHGQFRALQPLAAGGMPAGLAVDDLDHDGRLDLAAANNTTASVSIFQARPLGPSFRIRAPTHIPVGIPIGISVAPIDERGQTFADYSGTARFTTSIELPRGWPKEHTFTPSNNGVFGTEIAFPRPGYYHLRVIDKQNPDHAGAVTVLVGYVEDAQKSPLP